ncbi:zinc finger, CCHC-type containing protein [Tanacetum coccineum]
MTAQRQRSREEDEAENEPNRKAEKEKTTEAPSSQPVEYYLKHRINEKLIEGLEGLKRMNALVDQGSDVNVMPLSTYMKLTDERHVEIDIRLSLASHSYIYLLGIAEDVLVEVAEHLYPMEFVILDIKEDEKRPFILGTPFLTTAKVVIKFDKGTITLRLVLEWEERIKLHLERKMEFDQWKSKNFKGKHPTLFKVEGGMDDKGEVTLYLTRRSLEVLRKFHWMILG